MDDRQKELERLMLQYEKECLNVLPFPLNLCECCERYKKEEKVF